ncbi:MAG TPA: class I SAM-dependent methyltransferase [Vicinamibacteria bacterium]|nr:class I SAM-dependent methyltransferase [Vicinamibacteria bacterium]
MEERFYRWLEHLDTRHASSLTFAELRGGVVALSRIYVEERARLGRGAVFQGRAKRAAFACFYTPLHFLVIRRIIDELGLKDPAPRRILDLGCGLAAAGGAWSLAADGKPFVVGIDQSRWCVLEARRSLAALGLRGTVRREAIGRSRIPTGCDAVVAAYSVNELDPASRQILLDRLLRGRASALVVEPVAQRLNPWWGEWNDAFVSAGGEGNLWRFRCDLPERLKSLDRASGLDHGVLKVRSLVLRKDS